MPGNSYLNFGYKTFIKSSTNVNDEFKKIEKKNKNNEKLNFQGDEAKTAYEIIINETNNSNVKKQPKNLVKSKSRPSNVNKLKNNDNQVNTNKNVACKIDDIFKSIEQGDLQFLESHLTIKNVNIVDNFGWTPLMSAVFCGNVKIVEFLLTLEADKHCKDKAGFNALQLAQKKGYINIIKILKTKNLKALDIEKFKNPVNNDDFEEFYCQTCKTNYNNTTVKQHNASILHIFNSKPEFSGPSYGISKQNKGYQIMLNNGWNEEAGLGPSGSGLKYPVKTILKRDRKGLGNQVKSRAKVTHFASEDLNAVRDVRRHKILEKKHSFRRKDYEKILNRERRKEIALRQALS